MHKLSLIILTLIFSPLMAMESEHELDKKLYAVLLWYENRHNRSKAQELIDAGANVNYIAATESSTLLHLAVDYGMEESCMILLKNNADPNINDRDFELKSKDFKFITYPTPLMSAIRNNLIEASRIMIEKGANIHIANGKNQTALHFACYANLTDICLLLIKKGADVNAQTQSRRTPLLYATHKDNYVVCRALLAKGASLMPVFPTDDREVTSTIFISQEAFRLKASNACRAIMANRLFPSKERIRLFLGCLRSSRESIHDCPSFLYKRFKELLAPYFLYNLAMEGKAGVVYWLEQHAAYARYPIDLLNPEKIDQTIQMLVQEEINGTTHA